MKNYRLTAWNLAVMIIELSGKHLASLQLRGVVRFGRRILSTFFRGGGISNSSESGEHTTPHSICFIPCSYFAFSYLLAFENPMAVEYFSPRSGSLLYASWPWRLPIRFFILFYKFLHLQQKKRWWVALHSTWAILDLISTEIKVKAYEKIISL